MGDFSAANETYAIETQPRTGLVAAASDDKYALQHKEILS